MSFWHVMPRLLAVSSRVTRKCFGTNVAENVAPLQYFGQDEVG